MSWRPFVSEGSDLPVPIGEALDRYVRRFQGVGSAELQVVFGQWEDVVGPQVSAHATPLSLRNGTLVVGVDAPAWATQLRFLAEEFLRRIAELAGPGVVTAIDVRVRL